MTKQISILFTTIDLIYLFSIIAIFIVFDQYVEEKNILLVLVTNLYLLICLLVDFYS